MKTTDDYDSPWKDAIERYFPEFIQNYFPAAHRQIDWNQPYDFLEQELQAVVQDAEIGQRRVDKLVRVTLLSGRDEWIYIHIEVQSQAQQSFAERMFVYNYRLFDRYRRPIASLAVLADDNPDWKPVDYGFEALGCRHTLTFPVAKLLDYQNQEDELLGNPNPFALLTVAHLLTRKARRNMGARFDAKWKLIQLLYQHGWDKQRILNWFAVMDWMMRLPEDLERRLWHYTETLEENKRMRYVTSFERINMEKALQQELQKGRQEEAQSLLLRALRRRFGELPVAVVERVTETPADVIEHWFDLALDAQCLDDIFNDHDINRH